MHAWSSPPVPALPSNARAPEVRVRSSNTPELITLVPSGPARMYVCGITPYDATHMGHAATYVAFDLLNRAWRSAGHVVRYVQNITDVDDPLLERAAANGEDWVELAERETELFREDMTALRVLAPDNYVGAVESIPLVVEMVQELDRIGSVYPVPSTGPGQAADDLYFSISSDPDFGAVSGWDRARMLEVFPERGGDPDRAGKQDPLDCLLWQAERPGEPAWETALGRGRPGWHIECSAIARAHLDGPIDVQGGGSDLVFPHHEMSASEAQVVDRRRFAKAYVHAGMVGLDGAKMSKSKGNLVLVSSLRAEGVDPMAIRLTLLGHHYRTDWDWTAAALTDSEARLATWRKALAGTSGAATQAVVADVLTALADDLDAPRAVDRVHDWVGATLAGDTTEQGAPQRITTLLDAALGLAP